MLSYSRIVESMAQTVALPVGHGAVLHGLVEELGGLEGMLAWLVTVADQAQRPIGLHLAGTTTILSPPGWAQQRVEGWVAAQAGGLEASFGGVRALSRTSPAQSP